MPFDSPTYTPEPAEILGFVREQYTSGAWKWAANQDGHCIVSAILMEWEMRQPEGKARAWLVTMPESDAALKLLRDAISDADDPTIGDVWVIAEWNDAPERTFGDVLTILDKAQKLAEPRNAEITEKIACLKDQLTRIQSQCSHPADAMSYVSGSTEGDATGETAYYRNCHCRLCDKRWSEDA